MHCVGIVVHRIPSRDAYGMACEPGVLVCAEEDKGPVLLLLFFDKVKDLALVVLRAGVLLSVRHNNEKQFGFLARILQLSRYLGDGIAYGVIERRVIGRDKMGTKALHEYGTAEVLKEVAA